MPEMHYYLFGFFECPDFFHFLVFEIPFMLIPFYIQPFLGTAHQREYHFDANIFVDLKYRIQNCITTDSRNGHWNCVSVCLPFPVCVAANLPRNRLRMQPYLRSQPAALCPDTFPCMWKPIGMPAHCHHLPDWILRCIFWFWMCVDFCSILPNRSRGRHKNGVSMEVRSIQMINKLFAEATIPSISSQ